MALAALLLAVGALVAALVGLAQVRQLQLALTATTERLLALDRDVRG